MAGYSPTSIGSRLSGLSHGLGSLSAAWEKVFGSSDLGN